MSHTKLALFGMLLCGLGVSVHVHATGVTSSFVQSGSDWTYVYTVTNDTLPAPLVGLDLYFPTLASGGLGPTYPGLTLTGLVPPSGWTGAAFPASANFNPLVSFSASGLGIDPGGTLSGFIVMFTYPGPLNLGPQEFDVFDSSYNLLDAGLTKPTGGPVPDEGDTACCVVLALGALAALRRRFATVR
jgi:hypothetical protein